MLLRRLMFAALCLALSSPAFAETIDIAIGHQSMCTDTYTAGIIVKELGLLEKHLPHDGKYAGVKYDITWNDYSSGGPITNEMLADKLQFGVMGDYPLIVNGAQFQATDSLRSLYVAGTGYNLKGSGNGIVVPINSKIFSLKDLKGHSVSVPVGSAAWGMLIKALGDDHMTLSSIELKNQSPAVGAANIQARKIDAHADFCPWSEIMEYRGTGRKIYDGSQTGVPYLHGLVVRKDFATKYPEIVVAFIEAIHDAGDWVNKDPMKATEMMEKWTGVEKEVLYLYFSKGGLLTLDPTLKPQWIKTLEFDHKVLADAHLSPPLDFKKWVDDGYIRTAYKAMGLDYDRQLAQVVDPSVANRGLPDEIWHARDGIKSYPTMKAFLKAAADFTATGAKINATYVYDQATGLKLFGNSAFYVETPGGDYAAFLRKGEAEKYAADKKGKALTFDQAMHSTTS
ncbi:MAG TPA: ABC transporter substrate-binding protein [Stellaceae bacterium]|nr:ABC transporter substrate-binding protein [Stellaceae bacterium]